MNSLIAPYSLSKEQHLRILATSDFPFHRTVSKLYPLPSFPFLPRDLPIQEFAAAVESLFDLLGIQGITVQSVQSGQLAFLKIRLPRRTDFDVEVPFRGNHPVTAPNQETLFSTSSAYQANLSAHILVTGLLTSSFPNHCPEYDLMSVTPDIKWLLL
jgi:hypothetical protein